MRISSLTEMHDFGMSLGSRMQGGEVLELVGDVGAGKTSLTRGIARGMGITDSVQSPTFTISREYEADSGLRLVHYDFYRLSEAGIMADELSEALTDPKSVTIIEWAETVADVLPEDRVMLSIGLVADDENAREIAWRAGGEKSRELVKGLDA